MRHLNKLADLRCGRFYILIYSILALLLVLSTALLMVLQANGTSPASEAAFVPSHHGYFRTGQWRADALTLVAAARWCLEPSVSTAAGPTSSNFIPNLAATNAPTITRT